MRVPQIVDGKISGSSRCGERASVFSTTCVTGVCRVFERIARVRDETEGWRARARSRENANKRRMPAVADRHVSTAEQQQHGGGLTDYDANDYIVPAYGHRDYRN